MFNKFFLVVILIFGSYFSYGQINVEMSKIYGSENNDVQTLLNFENIYFEQLNFKGKGIKGKFYKVFFKEFKDDKLIDSNFLFDGTESELFRIKNDSLSIKFAFKLANGKLKAQIFGNGFESKKTYMPLVNSADDYALKDFFGSKQTLLLDANKSNAVFAIITPTIYPNGTGSYCDVAQSGIEPELLGKHFNIPHYFVIYMKFL